MIRRPLWNRGGGVFVEEAAWNVPVERRAAADLPAAAEPAPAVRTAPPADRARPKRPLAGERARREGLRARAGWPGVRTVREDD